MVKEWERRSNAFHALAYGSDRYVSGDRGVSFLSRGELVGLLSVAAPGLAVVCETAGTTAPQQPAGGPASP